VAADRGRDCAKLSYELCELIRVKRLRSIRQCAVWLRVHFDYDSVRAGGDTRARHRNHLVSQSRAMAGIGNDRQMREPVHDRNRRQIEHVARSGIEATNTAL